MHEEGLKLRASGGYGEYTYSDRVPSADPAMDPRDRETTFHAKTHYAEILVGYLMRFGELTAKAFVGPSIIGHDISPNDTETVVIGDSSSAITCGRCLPRCFRGWCFSHRHCVQQSLKTGAPVRVRISDVRVAGFGLGP